MFQSGKVKWSYEVVEDIGFEVEGEDADALGDNCGENDYEDDIDDEWKILDEDGEPDIINDLDVTKWWSLSHIAKSSLSDK